MTTINWRGRVYGVEVGDDGIIRVSRGKRLEAVTDAEDAIKWLSCNSLRKGKARKLVEDELASCGAGDQGSPGEISLPISSLGKSEAPTVSQLPGPSKSLPSLRLLLASDFHFPDNRRRDSMGD